MNMSQDSSVSLSVILSLLGKVPKSINRTIKYMSRAKKRRDSIKAYKNFYLLSCTLNDFGLFWSHLNPFSTLSVKSENETTNSPIHQFKVLYKGQRAFKKPFLVVYYFLFLTLNSYFKPCFFYFIGF